VYPYLGKSCTRKEPQAGQKFSHYATFKQLRRISFQVETELLEDVNTVGRLLDILQAKVAAKTSKQAA
jgi:hypothetical protein